MNWINKHGSAYSSLNACCCISFQCLHKLLFARISNRGSSSRPAATPTCVDCLAHWKQGRPSFVQTSKFPLLSREMGMLDSPQGPMRGQHCQYRRMRGQSQGLQNVGLNLLWDDAKLVKHGPPVTTAATAKTCIPSITGGWTQLINYPHEADWQFRARGGITKKCFIDKTRIESFIDEVFSFLNFSDLFSELEHLMTVAFVFVDCSESSNTYSW